MNAQPKEGDLRVWHIPQVPMKPFYVAVPTAEEGKRLMGVLADYDWFQLENFIKPDYSNVQGLEVFEGGQWCEWYNEDGYSIDDLEFDDSGQLVSEV